MGWSWAANGQEEIQVKWAWDEGCRKGQGLRRTKEGRHARGARQSQGEGPLSFCQNLFLCFYVFILSGVKFWRDVLPGIEYVASCYHVHAGGGQVVQPDALISYGAVPITYGDTAHIPVNFVETVVYYSLQEGAAQSVDSVMPVESTQLQLHSRPLSNSLLVTDLAGSLGVLPEVGPKSSLDYSSFSGKTEKKDSVPLPTSFTRTTSKRDSRSVSLGTRDGAAIAATAIATSNGTKER